MIDDTSFEAELQKTFLSLAQEMLEDTEASFTRIEQNPADSSSMDKIFRLVHTIKGSAHVAGFKDLGNFAHTFENLLCLIRAKKINVTSDVFDVLLAGNDCLTKYVSALIVDTTSSFDFEAVEARIRATSGLAVVGPSEPSYKSTLAVKINESAPTKPTFLVVDDEPDILDVISESLTDAGYEVIAVEDPREALEFAKTKKIDVIMTDLNMPHMNGIELVQAVREFNRYIPIVFISGHSSRENFKQYLDLGVDSFVEKPFEDAQLLAVASRVVREKVLRDALFSLTRFSFRVFVSFQKIEAFYSRTVSDEDRLQEKAHLDECMEEMGKATASLLESERALKKTLS
jgi:CheY-like chemotaxis protein